MLSFLTDCSSQRKQKETPMLQTYHQLCCRYHPLQQVRQAQSHKSVKRRAGDSFLTDIPKLQLLGVSRPPSPQPPPQQQGNQGIIHVEPAPTPQPNGSKESTVVTKGFWSRRRKREISSSAEGSDVSKLHVRTSLNGAFRRLVKVSSPQVARTLFLSSLPLHRDRLQFRRTSEKDQRYLAARLMLTRLPRVQLRRFGLQREVTQTPLQIRNRTMGMMYSFSVVTSPERSRVSTNSRWAPGRYLIGSRWHTSLYTNNLCYICIARLYIFT
jgi:hypothetical protein